ncbi:MAG: hypothetical protein AAF281_03990, partial [Pseudomonadota bacterium]
MPERARESEAARPAILDGLRFAGDWTQGGSIEPTIDRDALVALDRAMPSVLADLALRLPI